MKVNQFDAGDGVPRAYWTTDAGATVSAVISPVLDGDDVLIGGDGADDMAGFDGADALRSGRGEDSLSGGRGADVLDGGHGADVLLGGKGRDTLDGGRSTDVLTAGRGKDMLTGGRGNDVFVFDIDQHEGKNRIVDFEDGRDLIDLSGSSFDGLEIVGNSGLTRITLESGTVVFLEGIGPEAISADDFLF